MSGHEETNVRLPLCAFDALAAVAARRGISRDEAVRQVLDEHVVLQERRQPEDRLTHISTVLRYPPPPRWRREPRADRPLRLRLVPGVIARARAVSLRLPGQSRRAYRDYQSRLLTDAVMTAIAVQEPFSDEFLEDLLPLLRHAAALGLWQLAVAATSTASENAVHNAAEDARSQVGGPATPLGPEESAARRRLLRMSEALDEEVAWHSSVRFQVAENIARDKLSGANASANEQMLYQQKNEWGELRLDLRGEGVARDRYLRGTSSYDWSGRGGSAVWRAERKVEVQDFEDWLIRPSGPDPAKREVWPPGWVMRVPDTWRAHVLSAATVSMPEPYATWAAAGRLLAFPIDHKQVVWPLLRNREPPKLAPVPNIEPIVAAAAGLRRDQISGFIEAILVDWSDDREHSAFPVQLRLPAHKAFAFGLIDADEQRQAMAEARAATLQAMADIINELSDDQLHRRADLEQGRANSREFGLIASRLGIKFKATKATWVWPGGSIVDELHAGTRANVVHWLAECAYKACNQMLQQSMEQAWHDAFDHHPAAFWLPGCDTHQYTQRSRWL